MKKKNTVAIAENQQRINELEKDIKEIKITINDTDIPEETRSDLKETLSGMTDELRALKEENEKKIKNEKEKNAKPIIKVGGKLYEKMNPEELEKPLRQRMERVDKLGGMAKTKSIVEKHLQEEAE